MSRRGDVKQWVKDRLTENVLQLRDVMVIKSPSEILTLLTNAPSAAILMGPATGVAGPPPDTSSEWLTFPVLIYYSSEYFQGIEDDAEDNGIDDLFDAIYNAVTDPDLGSYNPPLPTGAYSPLRYASGDTESIADGLVVESMVFDVGIILEKT